MWKNRRVYLIFIVFLNKLNIVRTMNCGFYRFPLLVLFMVMLGASGCGQAEQANQHLSSMDETSKGMLSELKKSRESLTQATTQSERIADALVALQTLSTDLVKVIQATFIKKPPAATDDIDSVLNPSNQNAPGAQK